MSIVAVHGPHTWGQPFFAQTDEIAINILGPFDLEFKFLRQTDITLALVADPYDWDFGDGSELENGFEVRHIYATPGEKTVTVRVETSEGVRTSSITFTLPDDGKSGEVTELPKRKRRAKAA